MGNQYFQNLRCRGKHTKTKKENIEEYIKLKYKRNFTALLSAKKQSIKKLYQEVVLLSPKRKKEKKERNNNNKISRNLATALTNNKTTGKTSQAHPHHSNQNEK